MSQQAARPKFLPLVILGIAAGVLSGLFGVGGGVIIVPALALVLRMPQRLAAGTSVAAVLPAAIVGAITYAIQGHVDWIAGALLAIGIVIGAQIGSHLLARLPAALLQWLFLTFLIVVIVSLWFVVPQRGDVMELNFISISGLVLTGFVTGVLSGVLGVGGGVIVVPVLMFFFGASDLVAKGTSLLMMIPGSISGTIANYRRKNVDLRSAATIGIAASVFSPVGAYIASGIEPNISNIAFSIFLAFIFVQLLWKLTKAMRNRGTAPAEMSPQPSSER